MLLYPSEYNYRKTNNPEIITSRDFRTFNRFFNGLFFKSK